MIQLKTLKTGLAAAVASLALLGAPAKAADFYAGKQLVFLIGGDAGGGYDLYARAISRRCGAPEGNISTMVIEV
jgi:tripartite-type tricarboxylate transporter receptor subunit TctC